jgi:CheY-like chemotaxis protein
MLSSYRVLVVEDEPAVAEHITDVLTEAEGIVVGPASSRAEAQRFVSEGGAIDAALLDLNLPDGPVTPVLEALFARGFLPSFIQGPTSRRPFGSGTQTSLPFQSRCAQPDYSSNSDE